MVNMATRMVLVLGTMIMSTSAAPERMWSRIWGSSAQDVALDVAVDADGGVYVVGWTAGSFHGQINPGSRCAFITKYASDGTHQWTDLFGPATYSEATAVAVDSSGNVFVAGSTFAAFDDQQAVGSWDLFLCRYSSAGMREWTRIWGSTDWDEVKGIAIDPDGRIAVTGNTEGGFDGQTPVAKTDLFLSVYDPDGNREWTRIWGSASDWDSASAVVSDSDGNLNVCGFAFLAVDGQPHYGYYDVIVTRYQPDGTKVWTRGWGGADDQVAEGIAVDESGALYVAGYSMEGFNGAQHIGYADPFLMKVSPTGTALWTRIWGGAGNDFAADVTVGETNLYTVGQADANLVFDGEGPTNAELFMSRHGDDGAGHWSRLWGASKGMGLGVAFDGAQSLYVCGYTEGAFDGQTAVGGQDLFLTCWDSGEAPPVTDTVQDLYVLGADLPFELKIAATGDIDRIEFRINGELIGTSYGPVFEQIVDPGFLSQDGLDFQDTNSILATGFRSDGTVASVDEAFWVGSSGDSPPLSSTISIQEPVEGFVLYTDGPTASSTSILFRAEATYRGVDTDARLPAGGLLPSARAQRGEDDLTDHPVDEVRFYLDGSCVHTSTVAVAGYEQFHEVLQPVGGLPTGSHQVLVRIPATEAYGSASDIRSFTVEQRHPEIVVDRQVVRDDSHFEVALRVLNRGSGPAELVRLEENVQAYQICRITGPASLTNSYTRYETAGQSCRAVMEFDSASATIPAGSELVIQYAAVPILFPDPPSYVFGGGSANVDYLAYGTNVHETCPYVTTREWDGPEFAPLSDVVHSVIATSDYLVVASPCGLINLYGEDAANRVLETAAQLATRRSGVLGYYEAYAAVRTGYRAGDLIAAGDMFDSGDPFEHLFVGDHGDNRIRVYRRYQQVLVEEGWLPFEEDLRAGDAMVTGNFRVTDWAGTNSNPQAELIVAWGDEHEIDAGRAVTRQYRRVNGTNFVSQFTFSTSYRTGGGLAAARVWYPPDDAMDLVVAHPFGDLTFYSGTGSELADMPSAFNEGDFLAAGNLRGDAVSELVIGDIADDSIHIYMPRRPSTDGPCTYAQDYLIPCVLDPDDEMAVGDLLDDAHDEIAVADVSEEEVRIYAYDSAAADFILRDTMTAIISPDDQFTLARVSSRDRDQIVFFRANAYGARKAGFVEYAGYREGETPGNRYTLDALIDTGGAWARQLRPDWASNGYLLLIGETDILPTFTRSWDLISFDGGAGRVDYTDREYASTDSLSENDRPELAMGRIIGNSAERLENTLRTTLDILDGTVVFNTDKALTVSGRNRGVSGEAADIDHGPVRMDVWDSLARYWDFLPTLHEPGATTLYSVAEDSSVIFLAGHGNPWGWDVLNFDNVGSFRAGEAAPLVYACSCLTGRYGAGWTFAEEILANGASAWIGATEIGLYGLFGWGWCPELASEFFSHLEPGVDVGTALKLAKRRRLTRDANFWGDWDYNRYHTAIFHLYGDPKLEPDWGASAAARAVQADVKTDSVLQGPVSQFSVEVPSYERQTSNGVDYVFIPGQRNLLLPGNPVVPTYGVSIDFPPLVTVQDINLTGQSAPEIITNLNLPPLVPLIPDGETLPEPPPPGLSEVWPELEYGWDLHNNPDGSTKLCVTLYPLQYNTNTMVGLYTTNWQFDVSYAESSVAIVSIALDKADYTPGDQVTAAVELLNTNDIPVDVSVRVDVTADDGSLMTQSTERIMRGLSTWGTWQYQWDTHGVTSGTYAISFVVEDLQGVVLDREQALVTVGDGASGRIRDLGVTPRGFRLGDDVVLSGRFDNTGFIPLDGTFTFVVQDSRGRIVHTFQTPFSDLAVGQSVMVETTWQNAALVPRDTVILAYVEYADSTTAVSVAADWQSAPLRWDSIQVSSNEVVLTWPSVAGRNYDVLCATNLMSGSVELLISGLPATPPLNTYHDISGDTQRFFQLREAW